MTHIAFPFHFDNARRTAAPDDDGDYVRGLIEQVLFTRPGERVNRPDFGCGLLELVFSGNDPAAAASTQFMAQGALQRWLGEWITVESVTAEAEESTLSVSVSFRLKGEADPRVESFKRSA